MQGCVPVEEEEPTYLLMVVWKLQRSDGIVTSTVPPWFYNAHVVKIGSIQQRAGLRLQTYVVDKKAQNRTVVLSFKVRCLGGTSAPLRASRVHMSRTFYKGSGLGHFDGIY